MSNGADHLKATRYFDPLWNQHLQSLLSVVVLITKLYLVLFLNFEFLLLVKLFKLRVASQSCLNEDPLVCFLTFNLYVCPHLWSLVHVVFELNQRRKGIVTLSKHTAIHLNDLPSC